MQRNAAAATVPWSAPAQADPSAADVPHGLSIRFNGRCGVPFTDLRFEGGLSVAAAAGTLHIGFDDLQLPSLHLSGLVDFTRFPDGSIAWEMAQKGCVLLSELGVPSRPHKVVSLLTVAGALLEQCHKLEAGLLVLGAYVPSRLGRALSTLGRVGSATLRDFRRFHPDASTEELARLMDVLERNSMVIVSPTRSGTGSSRRTSPAASS